MEYTIVNNETEEVLARGHLREYTRRLGPNTILIHTSRTRAYTRLWNLAQKLGINSERLSIRIV